MRKEYGFYLHTESPKYKQFINTIDTGKTGTATGRIRINLLTAVKTAPYLNQIAIIEKTVHLPCAH